MRISELDKKVGRNLKIALFLSSLILILEIAGALYANSLALLSDAGHVFTDIISLLAAYAAFRIALSPPTEQHTFGYHRAEVFASMLNGALMGLIGVGILYEAFQRMQAPPIVLPFATLMIAALGLLGNLVVVGILRGYGNLNVKSAFMHALSDALASLGVMVSSAAILLTGMQILDAITSVFIAGLILLSAYRVLRSSTHILYESCPVGLAPARVKEVLRSHKKVRGVHDVHIWCICSDVINVSSHVVVTKEMKLRETERLARELQERLRRELKVTHTSFQFETGKHGHRKPHKGEHYDTP